MPPPRAKASKNRRMPCWLTALSCRAKSGECTRLRCLERSCTLRPSAEAVVLDGLVDGVPMDAEIAADDRQDDLGDMVMFEEEGEEAGNMEEAMNSKRDCIVDLWPFAFGMDFYKSLLEGMLGDIVAQHFVVLTTSAHPSPQLAGYYRGMTVYSVYDRVKELRLGRSHRFVCVCVCVCVSASGVVSVEFAPKPAPLQSESCVVWVRVSSGPPVGFHARVYRMRVFGHAPPLLPDATP